MNNAEAVAKLSTFADLKQGWDSYNAKEIDNWVIGRARILLQQWAHVAVLELSPMANGGIVIVFEGAPCMTIWVEPTEEPS